MAESFLVLMTKPGESELPAIKDLFRRPAWQRMAACRGESIGTFIPGRGGGFRPAKALCDVCPVGGECLELALADEDLVGMWDGTTENERRKIMVRRGAA
jgi:WhiB family redox-sensing transcriptional regulator